MFRATLSAEGVLDVQWLSVLYNNSSCPQGPPFKFHATNVKPDVDLTLDGVDLRAGQRAQIVVRIPSDAPPRILLEHAFADMDIPSLGTFAALIHNRQHFHDPPSALTP